MPLKSHCNYYYWTANKWKRTICHAQDLDENSVRAKLAHTMEQAKNPANMEISI
ncbi:MAG: hypothetical protein Q8L68_00560 [Methylococcales bacterium]|nr:hypothetical protein [Methylococcales bacterium]